MEAEVMEDHFPIRKDSLEEMVGHRNRALDCARQIWSLIQDANGAASSAAPGIVGCGFFDQVTYSRKISMYDEETYICDCRKVIDANCWKSLLTMSGLRNLMDTKTHQDWHDQVNKDPPEFTADNIVATFMGAASEAPAMLDRSVVNVFRSLNTKHYKTNSAFRIGPRIIMTGALSQWGGWNAHGWSRSMVSDMDRLMHVLDGKKPPEAGDASDQIGCAHAKKEATCTTGYFECRMFRGNGNLHIKFRRPELVDKVNRILAKHYGETLPDDRKTA